MLSLVLPIEEISLRPELSSPTRFRIQGGYPERYGRTDKGGRTEILVSYFGCKKDSSYQCTGGKTQRNNI